MKTLPFPLYHASSSIFSKSIKMYGLGGRNPINEFGVIDLIRKLKCIADKELDGNDKWLNSNLKLIIESFLNPSTKLFAHSGVYLTASLNLAKMYSSNKFGSEAISEAYAMVVFLQNERIEIPNELQTEFKDFFGLENTNPQPLIYKISNLEIDYLASGEDGETEVIKLIENAEYIINKYGDKGSMLQGINFRTSKIVPSELLVELKT